MSRRSALSLSIFFLIIIISMLIVFFARGYRVNLETKDVKSTGMLVATSFPDGASVFVDGKLKTATNNTINLNPGSYHVKITKESYIPWEKQLNIQGEIVTKTDAQLFPSTPELRPLTSTGVIDPKLSSDGSKISFFVKNSSSSGTLSKDGIWILNITDRTLPINPDSKQITVNSPLLDWSTSTLYWSPDSKEILSVFYQVDKNNKQTQNISQAFVLSTDQMNTTPINITNSISETLTAWQDEKQLKEKRVIDSLPIELQNIASSSATNIILSPDENKVLYTATKEAVIPEIITPPLLGTDSQPETRTIKPGNTYVFDIKEDKNFEVFKATPQSPSPKPLKSPIPSSTPTLSDAITSATSKKPSAFWLATSRHLAFIEDNTIYIMEYDATNKQALYGGPFEDSYLFPHMSGSKLIILTNYNKSFGSTPNLYAINLK